jgi:hypothetical protein
MNKKIISIMILVFLMSSFSVVFAADQWYVSSSKDEMTGEETWYALSPKTTTNNPMGFPYNGTKAWIGVGADGSSDWVYIGFSQEPNIKNTETKDGYSVFTTRVKWNDDVQYVDFSQDWGSRFVRFVEDKDAIANITQNNKVLLEIDWYGEGEVYFEFTLNGSADAIKKIRNNTN